MGLNIDPKYRSKWLNAMFGPESAGDTIKERARTSRQLFVRGQDQLSEAKPKATGLHMSAQEVLDFFGEDVFMEMSDYGTAILPYQHEEPSRTLRLGRKHLNMTREQVAQASGLPVETIAQAETATERTDIHDLARICDVLGLDVHRLGIPHLFP